MVMSLLLGFRPYGFATFPAITLTNTGADAADHADAGTQGRGCEDNRFLVEAHQPIQKLDDEITGFHLHTSFPNN